ncbi:MAG TPA: cobalt ECF transporter T component CbiQ [bacterium]|nr:cobalt ECF transporter T component CbiQ [bacterium]HQL60919.1 cobalt ECF transporter T component CbiQ [bacterium]
MKHEFLDHHSRGDSPLHRLEPRAKIIMVLAIVCFAASTPPGRYLDFLFVLPLLVLAMFFSRVPVLHLVEKVLKVEPFLLALIVFVPFFKEGTPLWKWQLGPWTGAVTREGVDVFLNVLCKGTIAILAMVLLNATTPFVGFLRGLESLRVPRLLVNILGFMYRYLFVLTDERERMMLALRSRCPYPRRILLWRGLSGIIGVLFIRAFERGERIYQAMCSRGFLGTIRTLDTPELRASDVALTVTVIAVCITGRLVAWLR